MAQHQHAPGQIQCLVDIMGDQKGREVLPFPERDQLGLQGDARQTVQIGERLVQQQDGRLVHESPRQRRTLCHATGKLVRIGDDRTVQADLPEHVVDALALRPQQTSGFQAKCHILPYGAPRIQRRVLKHQDARRIRPVDIMSSPMTMRPACGRSSPAIKRSRVDLPQPLGPRSAMNSPGPASRSICVEHGQWLPVQLELVESFATWTDAPRTLTVATTAATPSARIAAGRADGIAA